MNLNIKTLLHLAFSRKKSLIVLFLLLTSVSITIKAQTNSLPLGAAPQGISASVQASDGVYEKFVLIRWNALDNDGNYRVFRANTSAGSSLQELTKNWQKSNWFCDYSAEKGREYFYAITSSNGKQSSSLSAFDKGYLKNETIYAQDESLSELDQEKYASGRRTFVLISEVLTESTAVLPGAQIAITIGLQNIFDEPAPTTDLKIYLSKNSIWDFDDLLLTSNVYSGIPKNSSTKLPIRLNMPNDLIPGSYYLLVVASPEGEILNAKTGITPIKVIAK